MESYKPLPPVKCAFLSTMDIYDVSAVYDKIRIQYEKLNESKDDELIKIYEERMSSIASRLNEQISGGDYDDDTQKLFVLGERHSMSAMCYEELKPIASKISSELWDIIDLLQNIHDTTFKSLFKLFVPKMKAESNHEEIKHPEEITVVENVVHEPNRVLQNALYIDIKPSSDATNINKTTEKLKLLTINNIQPVSASKPMRLLTMHGLGNENIAMNVKENINNTGNKDDQQIVKEPPISSLINEQINNNKILIVRSISNQININSNIIETVDTSKIKSHNYQQINNIENTVLNDDTYTKNELFTIMIPMPENAAILPMEESNEESKIPDTVNEVHSRNMEQQDNINVSNGNVQNDTNEIKNEIEDTQIKQITSPDLSQEQPSKQLNKEPTNALKKGSKSTTLKSISIKQLKELITDIYSQKGKYDEQCMMCKLPKETMEQYMYSYLNQRYGLKVIQ